MDCLLAVSYTHLILHAHAHLHAALGVAGEEIAGCNIDAGMCTIEEAVNAAIDVYKRQVWTVFSTVRPL